MVPSKAFSASYKIFLEQFPIIGKINPEHWDFVNTIAGIFAGVTLLNRKNIPEKDKEAILDTVTKAAIEIYPDSIDACEDCRIFFDRTYDSLVKEKQYKDNPQFLSADSLGLWVAWNLFGHAPSCEDERKLIRILGDFLFQSFISWWK